MEKKTELKMLEKALIANFDEIKKLYISNEQDFVNSDKLIKILKQSGVKAKDINLKDLYHHIKSKNIIPQTEQDQAKQEANNILAFLSSGNIKKISLSSLILLMSKLGKIANLLPTGVLGKVKKIIKDTEKRKVSQIAKINQELIIIEHHEHDILEEEKIMAESNKIDHALEKLKNIDNANNISLKLTDNFLDNLRADNDNIKDINNDEIRTMMQTIYDMDSETRIKIIGDKNAKCFEENKDDIEKFTKIIIAEKNDFGNLSNRIKEYSKNNSTKSNKQNLNKIKTNI
jgi:hypothetical protein